jgi:outer membrane protein OmpA-like peptidoglycan-associated protein
MASLLDEFRRELAYIRASLLGRYRLLSLVWLLSLAALAWVCALSMSGDNALGAALGTKGARGDSGSVASGSVGKLPANAGGEVVLPPISPAPSTPSDSSRSSSELLLRIAQILCCTVIEFEEGKAVLSEASKATLSQLIPFFKDFPKARLFVDGHTDSAGSPNAAKELSLARAQATREYLVGQGVDAQQLEARGFGGEFPVADNNTLEGRRRNTRIEFRL